MLKYLSGILFVISILTWCTVAIGFIVNDNNVDVPSWIWILSGVSTIITLAAIILSAIYNYNIKE